MDTRELPKHDNPLSNNDHFLIWFVPLSQYEFALFLFSRINGASNKNREKQQKQQITMIKIA